MRFRALVKARPARPAFVGKMETTTAVPKTTPTPIISNLTESHLFTYTEFHEVGSKTFFVMIPNWPKTDPIGHFTLPQIMR